jgi:predicted phage terminase large subunit-like protein
MIPQQEQLCAEALRRRERLRIEAWRLIEIRESFESWCRASLPEGLEPAKHQLLIIETLQKLVNGKLHLSNGQIARRLLIMLPPGSAKSTYTSWLFPPWFLNLRKGLCILACSYSYDLVESFGRRCRNTIELLGRLLGYTLKSDSKAAGVWETTNDGRYFCAGVNAGIAGHRADLGLIDDPIGTEEQAQSKLFRDKLWEWYHSDFVPRLKPNAYRVLICNRRHEDDLAGRLLNPKQLGNEAEDWYVLSIPMEAEAGDVLGRTIGERLWPEWFNQKMVDDAKKNPRVFAGLYQQHPTPESGDFFKREWVEPFGYNGPDDMPKNLRMYTVSDHTTSKARGANKTCYMNFGVDEDNHIWIHPDLFWQQCSPLEAVEAMFAMVTRRHPIKWRAEKGHISQSLEPLINKTMQERGVYFMLEQVTPAKSKGDRCRSIAGRFQQGMVHLPLYAPWFSDALYEMMSFTGSGDDKSDDLCDCLGHIGMMVDTMLHATPIKVEQPQPLQVAFVPTMGWMKESARRLEHSAHEKWDGR